MGRLLSDVGIGMKGIGGGGGAGGIEVVGAGGALLAVPGAAFEAIKRPGEDLVREIDVRAGVVLCGAVVVAVVVVFVVVVVVVVGVVALLGVVAFAALG